MLTKTKSKCKTGFWLNQDGRPMAKFSSEEDIDYILGLQLPVKATVSEWRVNTNIPNFTVGKVYTTLSHNSFNAALKNDIGEVQYVAKKFLEEIVL